MPPKKKKKSAKAKNPSKKQANNQLVVVPTKTQKENAAAVKKAYNSSAGTQKDSLIKQFKNTESVKLVPTLCMLVTLATSTNRNQNWTRTSYKYFLSICAFEKKEPHAVLEKKLPGFIFQKNNHQYVKFRLLPIGNEIQKSIKEMHVHMQNLQAVNDQVNRLLGDSTENKKLLKSLFEDTAFYRVVLIMVAYHMVKHICLKALPIIVFPEAKPYQFCIFTIWLMQDCQKEEDYLNRVKSLAVAYSDVGKQSAIEADFLETWTRQLESADGSVAKGLGVRIEELAGTLSCSKEAEIYVAHASLVYKHNCKRDGVLLTADHLDKRGLFHELWWSSLVAGLFFLIDDQKKRGAHIQEFRGFARQLAHENSWLNPASKKPSKTKLTIATQKAFSRKRKRVVQKPNKLEKRRLLLPLRKYVSKDQNKDEEEDEEHVEKAEDAKKPGDAQDEEEDEEDAEEAEDVKKPGDVQSVDEEKEADEEKEEAEEEPEDVEDVEKPNDVQQDEEDKEVDEDEEKEKENEDNEEAEENAKVPEKSFLHNDESEVSSVEVGEFVEEDERKNLVVENETEESTTEVVGLRAYKQLSICPLETLAVRVNCRLVVSTEDRLYSLSLSNNEIYLAGNLHTHFHGRETQSASKPFSLESNMLHLPSWVEEYIDPSDVLHVIRPGVNDLPKDIDWGLVVDVLTNCGERQDDGKRGPVDMKRMHIGYSYFGNPHQFGGYKKANEKMNKKQYTEVEISSFWSMIGMIAAYTSRKAIYLQSRGGRNQELFPDRDRDAKFAANIREKLSIPGYEEMGFEIVIPSVYTIYPVPDHGVPDRHKDKCNAEEPGYNKCACLNIPLLHEDGSTICLFQMILGNRRVISNSLKPPSTLAELCDKFPWSEEFLRAGKDFCAVEYDPSKKDCSFLPWRVGDLCHLYCPFVAVDKLVDLVSYYHTFAYKGKFQLDASAIRYFNTRTGRPNANGYRHGEYLMTGSSKFHQTEKEIMDFIKDGIKSQVGDCAMEIKFENCGVIQTVNGQYHQPSHLDHSGVLGGNRGYIGHMGLCPEGCLLRLDVVKPQALACHVEEGEAYLPENIVPWSHIYYVHIPFGSILLIDAKQFHGGHYGTNHAFRFHCVLSNFEWGGNKPDEDNLVFLSDGCEGNLPSPRVTPKVLMRHILRSAHESRVNEREKYMHHFTSSMWNRKSNLGLFHVKDAFSPKSLEALLSKMNKGHEEEEDDDDVIESARFQGMIWKSPSGGRMSTKGVVEKFRCGMLYFLKKKTKIPEFLTGPKVYVYMIEPVKQGIKDWSQFHDVSRLRNFQLLIDSLGKLFPVVENCQQFAGTLLLSSNEEGAGPRNISIIEGHTHPNAFDWLVHIPMKGKYWMVFGLLTGGIPKDKFSVGSAGGIEAFTDWISSLRDSGSRLIVQKLEAKVQMIREMGLEVQALLCEPTVAVYIPLQQCYHMFFVGVGDDGPISMLILHSLVKNFVKETRESVQHKT